MNPLEMMMRTIAARTSVKVRPPADEIATLRAAHAALLRRTSNFTPGDLVRMKPELLPTGFLADVCPSGIFLVVSLIPVRSDRAPYKNRGDLLLQFTNAQGHTVMGKFDTRCMETVAEKDLVAAPAEKPYLGLISSWHRYTAADGCQIKGLLTTDSGGDAEFITTTRVLREEKREPIADVPVTRVETEDARYDLLGRELGE